MMVKGNVLNNTGKSRHIFKRTVYPGQSVSLEYVQRILENKVPEGASFVDWLEQYLPTGWEITVAEPEKAEATGGRVFVETLTAVPTVAEETTSTEVGAYQENNEGQENTISMEYATPQAIRKLSARDIYNLRLKDNPKRVLKNINSIHKLRRALTFCKNDLRKVVLLRLIQGRIRELNITL